MTDVNIFGQIRGAIRQYFPTSQQQVQPVLADGGEQVVNPFLPERAELTKMGKSWGAAIPTGSAFTFVNAWPTTRAELVMINGESVGGPSYVVDRVWMTTITSGNTGAASLLAQVVPATSAAAGVTGPATADNAAVLRHQLSGRVQAYSGNARFALANVQFAVANQWFPVGPAPGGAGAAAASTLAQTVEGQVQGRIIIPPQGILCLAGIGVLAAGTAIAGLEWHELQLNLG